MDITKSVGQVAQCAFYTGIKTPVNLWKYMTTSSCVVKCSKRKPLVKAAGARLLHGVRVGELLPGGEAKEGGAKSC